MAAALLICIIYAAIMWLVFFKFKWIKFSITWAVVSSWVGLHLLLVFMVGMRFMTPASSVATIVQYTIQIVPRLPEPTLVTEVLVEQNQPVKRVILSSVLIAAPTSTRSDKRRLRWRTPSKM